MLNKELTTTYDNVKQLYEDWKYLKNEDVEHEFYELNDYKTTMRGIKVRGVYDSYKEATVRAQVLRRKDPSFNVFVGQIGYWLPWDPECEAVPEQEYQEGQLNELVKKYKENLDNKDNLYDQLKNERIEKAKKEINARKEALKTQNETNVPINNEEVDLKNIKELREIVDESDKLYYDNLKNNEKNTENENQGGNSEEVNNFKSESMKNLEEVDPWLSRKDTN
jgi:hypothetical protein